MPYTPLLATLGYVMSADGQKTLLIHRNSRDDDLLANAEKSHAGRFSKLLASVS